MEWRGEEGERGGGEESEEEGGCHLLVLGQLEALLGDGHQVLAVELLQLLHHVLVDRLGHVDHLGERWSGKEEEWCGEVKRRCRTYSATSAAMVVVQCSYRE